MPIAFIFGLIVGVVPARPSVVRENLCVLRADRLFLEAKSRVNPGLKRVLLPCEGEQRQVQPGPEKR
jgi:hypothetical protein